MKTEHGVIDNRAGRFHPSSKPNPTRTARGSLGKANTNHLDSAISTAQGLALQTGQPVQVASRITDHKGTVTVLAHGAVRGVLKGAKPATGSGNQMGRSTSNKGV